MKAPRRLVETPSTDEFSLALLGAAPRPAPMSDDEFHRSRNALRQNLQARRRAMLTFRWSALACAAAAGVAFLWFAGTRTAPSAQIRPETIRQPVDSNRRAPAQSNPASPPIASDLRNRPSRVDATGHRAMESTARSATGGGMEPSSPEAPPTEPSSTQTVPSSASHTKATTATHRSATRRRETSGTETGTLTINSLPWARIFLDGRNTGFVTPVRGLELAVGRHRLGLQTGDGQMHSFSIQVAAGETTRVVRRLNADWPPPEPTLPTNPSDEELLNPDRIDYGTLRINSTPAASIYVDGRLQGTTPQLDIRVPPGRRRITLINREFNIRRVFSVTVEAGHTTTRVFNL